MTEKRQRWQSTEWYEKTKPGGNNRPEVKGESSHDTWDISRPKGKWRENSAEAFGTAVKEKSNTWNKSCRESTKREADLCKMVEIAVTDDTRERGIFRDLLGELRKRRQEEDDARNLIEEMQRNVDEARNKSYELEQKLNRIPWEYIEAFDKERERSRLMMTKHSGKMMQSRETKILSLEKDLDENWGKIKQTGWSETTRTKRLWLQDE